MIKDLIVVPLDNRPCTYKIPQQLGSIYGTKVSVPPMELIGNLEKPADRKNLSHWLVKKAISSDGLILSIDTLAYGGLIHSRKTDEDFREVGNNLLIVRDLKKFYPHIPIYASSTITRISNSNENQEEKEYWKDYGELIYKYSVLLDKLYLISPEEYENFDIEKILNPKSSEPEILRLNSLIPKEILRNYLETRFRNFRINKLMIKWVKEGIIDFLVISSDDSSEYGFNVIEKKILTNLLEKLPFLKSKIMIYPGADEVISVLVARFINKRANFVPRYYIKYSKPKCSFLLTMYEGIALKETIDHQIKAIGGVITNTQADANAILYIHSSSTKAQEDQYLNTIYEKDTTATSDEIIESDIIQIKRDLNQNVVLIDLAFANGADHRFMNKLSKNIHIDKLFAYSAWNTAGNSIGCALAHSSIRLLGEKKNLKDFELINFDFLMERFLDDWLYQSYERLNYIKTYKNPLFYTKLDNLKEHFPKTANEFLEQFKNYKIGTNYTIESIEIKDISFPWNRPFEADINLKIRVLKN